MDDNKTLTQDTQTTGASTNEEKKVGKEATEKKTSFSQTDVDFIASKVRGEEKSKQEEIVKKAVAEAIADYERQAKLTEEERANELKAKQEQALQDRENSITLRERRIEAQEILKDNAVPVSLVDFVVDLDKDKTNENIKTLADAFSKAVEEEVKNKLAGNPPKDPTKTETTKTIQTAF